MPDHAFERALQFMLTGLLMGVLMELESGIQLIQKHF